MVYFKIYMYVTRVTFIALSTFNNFIFSLLTPSGMVDQFLSPLILILKLHIGTISLKNTFLSLLIYVKKSFQKFWCERIISTLNAWVIQLTFMFRINEKFP